MASARRKKNSITQLKDNMGNWVTWQSGLPEVVSNYFDTLFTSSQGQMESILECVGEKVTTEQNSLLQQPVTWEEVRDAVFNMHPDKATGLDGLNPGFYQSFWQVVSPK